MKFHYLHYLILEDVSNLVLHVFQDFTGNDRKKEEKYMERTDEVIYQRAAEEHIRRPPLWHDEEMDSVRVRLTCKVFMLCTQGPVNDHCCLPMKI